jgi:hypothetical protein
MSRTEEKVGAASHPHVPYPASKLLHAVHQFLTNGRHASACTQHVIAPVPPPVQLCRQLDAAPVIGTLRERQAGRDGRSGGA